MTLCAKKLLRQAQRFVGYSGISKVSSNERLDTQGVYTVGIVWKSLSKGAVAVPLLLFVVSVKFRDFNCLQVARRKPKKGTKMGK